MDAHISVLIVSLASIVTVSIIAWTMLTAWRDWLAHRRSSLQSGHGGESGGCPTVRIELAALKERVRKLEAIASGVDLLP